MKQRGCYLYRVNGMPDHIHILADLHPTVSPSNLVGEIKSKTSQWIKKSDKFPLFEGWGAEYFCESLSTERKHEVINYIIGQQAHHGMESYETEMKNLYMKNGLAWDSRDLT